ncbi:Alpha/Beta hydrolase protein [Hyaloraphidium curvatum]|nr:Alpha/Beta hydrolase protein [Hyaloraphidium curvatum]
MDAASAAPPFRWPPPTSSWTWVERLLVPAGRYLAAVTRNRLKVLRAMSALSVTPVPRGTRIVPFSIPRKPLDGKRSIAAVGGIDPADLVGPKRPPGDVTGEWIIHPDAGHGSKPADDPHGPPVTLFIHGGGYVMSSAAEYRMLTWRLSAFARVRVLALDYPLAPEYPFPAALEDAVNAYLHLSSAHGPVALCGDSAGAGLATALALYLAGLADPSIPSPSALVLLSPWTDLTHSMPSFRTNALLDWLPGDSKDPALGPDGGHYYTAGLPARVGTAERLRDEGLAFALRTGARCEVYDGKVHGWQCGAPYGDVGAERAVENIALFLGKAVREGLQPEERTGFSFWSGAEFRTVRHLSRTEIEEALEHAKEEAGMLGNVAQ